MTEAKKKGKSPAELAAAMIARGRANAPETPKREEIPPKSGARAVLGRIERAVGPRIAFQLLDVSPKRCRVWALQGRIQQDLNATTVDDIVRSILVGGQLEPVLVRRVEGDPDHDYEVLDGSRRRLACEILGRSLQAVCVQLDDRQAAMLSNVADSTLRHSLYEKGVKYRAWMDAGIADSVTSVAELADTDKGQVSRALNLADVPWEYLNALGGHRQLGKPMVARLCAITVSARKDSRLEELVEAMRHVGSQEAVKATAPALQVLRTFEGKAEGKERKGLTPLVAKDGTEVGRIRFSAKSFEVSVPTAIPAAKAGVLKARLEELISEVLSGTTP